MATAGAIANIPNTATALFLLLFITLSSSQRPPIQVSYDSFNLSTTTNDFSLANSSSSSVSQGALQITPDTTNQPTYLVNKSGRLVLKRPFTLYSPGSNTTTTRLASFNTSFSINIYRINNATPGEGLAFLIAPSLDGPPPDSYGQYLGLTNSSTDGSPSNHFVAVELDTLKQSFDPDDNHVGLNINSVRSNKTTSLTPLGIQIAPANATNYTVWIDYDGAARHIYVYMAPHQNSHKPSKPVLDAPLDISLYLPQHYSYLGFAGSTGTDYQLNCVLSWDLSVEDLESGSTGTSSMAAWKWAVFVGLPVAIALACAGAGLLYYYYYYWRRRRMVRQQEQEMVIALGGKLKSLPGTPKEFEFKVIKKATNNFDERMKLGQGGFGVVYRGVMLLEGMNVEVAVKKFSRDNIKGQDDFLSELSIINRLRHRNLVRLLGWCHENGMLLLVYDYMPNGSLDHHLFCERGQPILTWDHRYKILTGVASALHYLHNEYDQKVVHRDLKASNILLESNFNARLGDFGLARALDTDKTSYIDVELGGVAGTMGYIAPECFHTGKATGESDVFAFGAVILEVVCGRRPRSDISGFQFLTDWVWKLHREDRILDAVDPRLDGQFVKEDAVRLLLLGLSCTHPLPKERPKTAAIVQIIARSLAPPVVPPFKPAFVWPSGPVDDGDCTADSMSLTSSEITSPFNGSSIACTPRASELFTNG